MALLSGGRKERRESRTDQISREAAPVAQSGKKRHSPQLEEREVKVA